MNCEAVEEASGNEAALLEEVYEGEHQKCHQAFSIATAGDRYCNRVVEPERESGQSGVKWSLVAQLDDEPATQQIERYKYELSGRFVQDEIQLQDVGH